jgi:hypothetical protein
MERLGIRPPAIGLLLRAVLTLMGEYVKRMNKARLSLHAGTNAMPSVTMASSERTARGGALAVEDAEGSKGAMLNPREFEPGLFDRCKKGCRRFTVVTGGVWLGTLIE